MDTTTLDAYDRQSGAFAKEWDEQPAPTDLQAIVRQYFRPGLTADVGCGSGRDAAWLCENGYPAIGFDPSEGLLKEAQQRHPGVRFQRGALPDLADAAEGSFVNVLCETVIMHLGAEIIASSVRKLLALLESGGTLYLSWRVTEGRDKRDEHGRLYAAFDSSLVLQALSTGEILLDEEKISASSGKTVHRIVARKI
ncbi:MAG: class I SAM-dependent methyltransferase [Syntrophales bacterium]